MECLEAYGEETLKNIVDRDLIRTNIQETKQKANFNINILRINYYEELEVPNKNSLTTIIE